VRRSQLRAGAESVLGRRDRRGRHPQGRGVLDQEGAVGFIVVCHEHALTDKPAGGATTSAAAEDCRSKRTVNQNVEPFPGALSTPSWPPCAQQSVWKSASRGPSRMAARREPSTWRTPEQGGQASAGMPMPVSLTAKYSSTWVGVSPLDHAPEHHLACLGELDPFTIRLVMTCRDGGSPASVRTSPLISDTSSMCLLSARSASNSIVLSTVARRSKSRLSKCSLPASIFEKSRMSLMIAARFRSCL